MRAQRRLRQADAELVGKRLELLDDITIETDLGAMVFPAQVDHVEKLVQSARAAGAKVELGGERLAGPGRFFPPNISGNFADGPVRAVARFAMARPKSAEATSVLPQLVSSGSFLVMAAGEPSMGGRVSRRAGLRSITSFWWTMPGAIPATESGQDKKAQRGTW